MSRASLSATAPGDGVGLRGFTEEPEEAGEGSPRATVVLAHGLTAHRDLVVHGSRVLPRRGFRLVSADARGHGESDPGPEGSYAYPRLADDLAAVIEAGVPGDGGRPVLAGHSMGAHTIAALALRDPGRFAGLVLIGPATPGIEPAPGDLRSWDGLAEGMASGGVEGFLRAYERDLNPAWRDTLLRIARDRLNRHRHPEAVARALHEVPRSVPFDGLGSLRALELPVLVVASHDEADPGHPYAIAEAYAETLPDARLISEEKGESPLAWQGGKLSREIAAFCASDPVRERIG